MVWVVPLTSHGGQKMWTDLVKNDHFKMQKHICSDTVLMTPLAFIKNEIVAKAPSK